MFVLCAECIVLLGCLAMQNWRVRGGSWLVAAARRVRRSGARGGGHAGVRSTRNNPSYFGRAAPRRRPRSAAGATRASHTPHYPLTIRNRPTSWLLDLGYNDLTSAK